MDKRIQRRRDEFSLSRTAINDMQAKVGSRALAKEILLSQARIRRNQQTVDQNRRDQQLSEAIDQAYKPLTVTW